MNANDIYRQPRPSAAEYGKQYAATLIVKGAEFIHEGRVYRAAANARPAPSGWGYIVSGGVKNIGLPCGWERVALILPPYARVNAYQGA